MRSRLFVAAVLCASLVRPALAQDAGAANSFADGLVPGSYLRVSGGAAKPINAQGSLRDWQGGSSFAAEWESWSPGAGGVGLIGFGLSGSYSMLTLDEPSFRGSFASASGAQATSATASHAGVLEITSLLRIRVPAPLLMPAITVGFGFLNWAPGTVNYTLSNGTTGNLKQRHRSGAELSAGGSLERQIYDRFGIYGEAMYSYGFTGIGRGGYVTPGSTCASNSCDALKNTSIGVLRGGLRVRLGQ